MRKAITLNIPSSNPPIVLEKSETARSSERSNTDQTQETLQYRSPTKQRASLIEGRRWWQKACSEPDFRF